MYVLTGATGNTGHVVAKHLLGKGQRVRCIGRTADRLQPLVQAGAEAFVAGLGDQQALARAFNGASAVYIMVPPNLTAEDPAAYQREVTEATVGALIAAKVAFAVTLSSIGADKAANTGPVVGLHDLEEQLNQVKGLNVLHLRPAYFMENTLAQAGIIQAMGMSAGPLRANLRLPMIATRDVGLAAAEELLSLSFQGKQTRELLGQRDLSMTECAAIIGKAIGKPDLVYKQLPDEQVRQAFIRLGMSASVANMLLELAAALNSGRISALEPRSSRNTTPTSYEAFVADQFIPVYEGKVKAA